MKKIICAFLMLMCVFNTNVFAINENEEEFDETWIYEAKNEIIESVPEIYSRCAIAIDRESKKVLYSKDENLKVAMASTTKIMTAIIVLEKIKDFSEQVNVDKLAALTQGSRLGLSTGNKISYNDLLYGLLLCSGNDAAMQLAISISGNMEEFAKLMNNKAVELNLINTNFVTPHGLDREGHFTTAYELAMLTDYALSIEKFAEIVNTKTYTVTINGYAKVINNTNELLGCLTGVNGVKTGYTSEAGRCLVTSVLRENFNIVVVILGADTKKIRTKDSTKIIEYCYKNYRIINLEELVLERYNEWCDINKKRITIQKGLKNDLKLKISEIKYINRPIIDTDIINVEIESNLELDAPVRRNESIGNIIVFENNTEVLKLEILTNEEIQKKNQYNYFIELLDFCRHY